MVQQLFSEIERLKAEVARLRGRVDSFSAGGNIIPSNITFNPTQSNNAQSVIQNFINNSGGNLVDGDVVVLDQTGERLITTTVTPQDITVLGVVRDFRSLGPFANAAETPVLLLGNMTLLKVNGAVAIGDYLTTSASTTRAGSVGADETQPGIFAIAESINAAGDGTVTASVFPVSFGASTATGSGAMGPPGIDGAEGEEGPMGPPGPVGPSGAAGSQGPAGEVTPTVLGVMHDELGDEPLMMFPPGVPTSAQLTADASFWFPDAPPVSAGADDDEFADNSGGVPGGWTEVDFGTSVTVTEDEAGLKIISTAAAGNAGVYKAIPAGDFTIWTNVSVGGIAMTDFVPCGLVLWEDATNSAGDLRTFYLESSATAVRILMQNWTAYNVHSLNVVSLEIPVDTLPTSVYLRIRRTGTTYAFDVSTEGINWYRVYSTGALGITPTHYGPTINTNSHATTPIVGRFPFFRYVASDVGIDGLMNGDRVKLFRN